MRSRAGRLINRRNGLALRLITAVRMEAGMLPHPQCYFCSNETDSPFYLACGFQLIEANVGGLSVFSISRHS